MKWTHVLVLLLGLYASGVTGAIPMERAYDLMNWEEHLWFLAVPGTSSSNMEQVIRLARHEHHSVMHRMAHPSVNDTKYYNKNCRAMCTKDNLPPRITSWLGRSHRDFDQVGILESEGKRPLWPMTIMRDPLKWSLRMFMKRILDPAYEARVGKPIAEWSDKDNGGEGGFITWLDNAYWKWNFFARSIAGDISSSDLLHSDPTKDDITREQALQYILDMEVDPDTADLFQRALENFRRMEYFGLFERLDETFELLSYKMCWDHQMVLEESGFHVRRYQPHPTLTPSTLAYLSQYNIIDLALYEEAQRIFEERYQEMKRAQANVKPGGYVCHYPGRAEPCFFECTDKPGTAVPGPQDGEL